MCNNNNKSQIKGGGGEGSLILVIKQIHLAEWQKTRMGVEKRML